MADYIAYSTRIYEIYLKYVSCEDIHVYSIDEVFIDVTNYLNSYQMSAHQLAKIMIQDVLKTTGITATAGIGSNLYLCKVAMDIVAKKVAADKDGVRIAQLDEMTYRKMLWSHRPLTDFWRVGQGYRKKLEAIGLYTMGDIARFSLNNEDVLYKLFGINAELLIDHAWGWEPVTIKDIKTSKPHRKSLGSGQVLQEPYSFDKARLIVKEMADSLALDLVKNAYVTDQIVLTVGYDREIKGQYTGEMMRDMYGRMIPKQAHGTFNLTTKTASGKLIMEAAVQLYERIVDDQLSVRRIYLVASHIFDEAEAKEKVTFEQVDLFTDFDKLKRQKEAEEKELAKEKKVQKAILDIKSKFGKNAVIKGMSLEEGATAIERNNQIGGHKA